MSFVDVLDPGPFRRPVTVVALDGWVNAGAAATIAADFLAEDAPVVARFDGDRLFDYRMSRPVIDFVDGVIQTVQWPELAVRVHRTEKRDLLVLTGIEPNWNWQALGDEIAGLAGRWQVERHISIGGVPWAAPHTRPVSVMSTGSSVESLEGDEHPSGLLRVPGAAVSAIEWKVSQAGFPTHGFWARVPNYVGSSYTAAALALLDRLGRYLGLAFDTSALVETARQETHSLDQALDARPDIRTMVEQFEQLYDSQIGTVSGEDLAGEIERFLRDQS